MSNPRKSRVSKAAKASNPTPGAGRNLPKGTTALDLAILAALLAPKGKPPEEFLAGAENLLQAANERLASRFPDAISRVLGFKSYSFAELLQPLTDQPANGKKKSRTMLGEISTRQGLTKAIRRAFCKELADAIIAKGEIQFYHLQCLQDDLAHRRGSRKKPATPVKE